jgi:hypothetical protein
MHSIAFYKKKETKKKETKKSVYLKKNDFTNTTSRDSKKNFLLANFFVKQCT